MVPHMEVNSVIFHHTPSFSPWVNHPSRILIPVSIKTSRTTKISTTTMIQRAWSKTITTPHLITSTILLPTLHTHKNKRKIVPMISMTLMTPTATGMVPTTITPTASYSSSKCRQCRKCRQCHRKVNGTVFIAVLCHHSLANHTHTILTNILTIISNNSNISIGRKSVIINYNSNR